MGWKIRNRVPSDEWFKEYDARVAAREEEIRRPARKINVISNEEWDRMQRRKQIQHNWQQRYMQEVRRRNRLIRYKLFQFFKDNYDLEGGDEALAQRALAAVCKSITKDFLLYCQVHSMGENMEDIRAVIMASDPRVLRQFAHDELGIRVDDDDIHAVMSARWQKKAPSELISEQIKADLKEVQDFQKLVTALNESVPEYIDNASKICFSVRARIETLDRENENETSNISRDWGKSVDDLVAAYKRQGEEYMGKLHKAIDGPGPSNWDIVKLTSEQSAGLKSVLNTKEQVNLFKSLYTEAEWSDTLDGLKQEEEVLASIVDDEKIMKALLEAILEAHTGSNDLVHVTATIRNESHSGDCLDKEAGFQERYHKALKEHVEKFKVSREYTDVEKLFGLDHEVSRGYRHGFGGYGYGESYY